MSPTVPILSVLFVVAATSPAPQKTSEDRQIKHALYDIGEITVGVKVEPEWDDCGDQCKLRITLENMDTQKVEKHRVVTPADGDQKFTKGLNPLTSYKLLVCRVDDDGNVIPDTATFQMGDESKDFTRKRCDVRICRPTYAMQGSLNWCGHKNWVEEG